MLLGDSAFDNGSYTGGAPDVVTHLRTLLPADWRATLLAVDAATASDVQAQAERVPSDASHLVLSIGGNDALLNADALETPVRSTAGALTLFATRVERFEKEYRQAIAQAIGLKRDVTVCTIYNGALEPERAALARVGLMLFNDVILRVSFEHALKVIDLRLICTEPADYANPIEPSGRGGLKIADAIARACGALPGRAASQVYA